MNTRSLVRRFFTDSHGGAAIEFGLLAPAMIAMLMGIVWSGIQMKSYNELRSIAADVSRYTVIEYQKSNKLTTNQISEVAAATAVRLPYGLDGDNLDVTVTEQTSPVASAKKLVLVLSYTAPPDLLKIVGVSAPLLTYTKTVYVPA